MPRTDDTLDSLQGVSNSSSLDLHSGYWQIFMAEEDKRKTEFVTPDELFESTVMPFDLTNVPATFEQILNTILHGLRRKICLLP